MPKANVLIVEDEPLIQMLWEDVFYDAGMHVGGTATTIKEALRLLKEQDFTAVVLDVQLRDGTSEPVAEYIRQLGIPAVVCSGDIWGMSDLFKKFPHKAKPFAANDYDEVVHELSICPELIC